MASQVARLGLSLIESNRFLTETRVAGVPRSSVRRLDVGAL